MLGQSSVQSVMRFKNMGFQAGSPDLLVALPGGHVAWIEMKRAKGGVMSKNQIMVRKRLKSLGQRHIEAYSAFDALSELSAYWVECGLTRPK